MPTYQNVTPPISLFSGDVGFSFDNETFPTANTAGSQFALPSFTGLPDSGAAVRWQTISPWDAKYCARNSTPWPATPRAHCSPGTVALAPHRRAAKWFLIGAAAGAIAAKAVH